MAKEAPIREPLSKMFRLKKRLKGKCRNAPSLPEWAGLSLTSGRLSSSLKK